MIYINPFIYKKFTTLLMAHFNISPLVDHSRYNNTLTLGTMSLDSNSKWGSVGKSLSNFDPINNGVSITPTASLQPSNGDYTIEFYYTNGNIAEQNLIYFSGAGSAIKIKIVNSTTMLIQYGNLVKTIAYTYGLGNWHHIALVKHGKFVKFFIDGGESGGLYQSFDTTAVENSPYIPPGTYSNFTIGSNFGESTIKAMQGKLDELRITKGALYTDIFVKPTIIKADIEV